MTQTKWTIGADEAGYGPNLGPLVVAATQWESSASYSEEQFEHDFAETFFASPWTAGCSHIPLGDSKQLFRPNVGVGSLEAGVLALLRTCGHRPQSLDDLLRAVTHTNKGQDQRMPAWYASTVQLPFPVVQRWDEIDRMTAIAESAMRRCGIRLTRVHAIVIFEPQFNAAIESMGSKGRLLSQVTLDLVAQLVGRAPLGGDTVEVFCDRQGGRKNYLPVLLEAFPDHWFAEVQSSARRCSYRSNTRPSFECHFTVGGDQFPPTALASMVAKYIRELLMNALNAFWKQHVPELAPTAGYPVDARRFRLDIAHSALQLNLPDTQWWRCR